MRLPCSIPAACNMLLCIGGPPTPHAAITHHPPKPHAAAAMRPRRDVVAALGLAILAGGAAPALGAAELSEEASLVVDAWAVVQRGYVDQDFNGVDWKATRSKYVKRPYKSMAEARAAVAEMLGLLGDRYTRYVTPSGYETLLARFEARSGEGGIGVQLGTPSGGTGVELLSVADGSPAAAAGLRPGAVVLAVDGIPVGTASAEEIAARILGPLDEKVRVEVSRGGETVAFSLQRRRLDSGEVVARVVALPGGKGGGEAKVGLLTIREFSDASGGSGGTLASLRRGLDAVSDTDVTLIDVRGNPGGHFPTGIECAKLFLPSDVTVVATADRTRTRSPVLTTSAGPYAGRGKATYLLVDRGTASAAEVFVAALQDNRAGTVIGETTFGKGLIQSIARVSDGGAVVCTVARYVTPSGRDINGVGVRPDRPCKCAQADAALDCLERVLR